MPASRNLRPPARAPWRRRGGSSPPRRSSCRPARACPRERGRRSNRAWRIPRAGARPASRLAGRAVAEQLRWVGHAGEPGPRHLEDTELVRRAEAVLDRAQDAVLAVAVALELEHAVDEVLEHARAGHGAVFRHVADEEDGDS